MSFPDSRPPLMPSLGAYSSGHAIGLCPQFPIHDGFQEHQYSQLQHQGPPFKRPKTSPSNFLSEIHSNSLFFPFVSNDSVFGCCPRFPTINEDQQHSQFEQLILPCSKKPRISEQPNSISLPCPPINNGISDDDYGFWDQHSQFEQHAPPLKKPRFSEEIHSNSLPYPPLNASTNPPPSAQSNKGAKFKVGICRNDENCNFAHGIENLPQLSPNWQGPVEDRLPSGNWDGDQKLIHWMKRCSFLHEHPAKFGDKLGRFSQSKVLRMVNGRGCNDPENNRSVNTSSDELPVNPKPAYWKTKLCKKWETRGICSFGEKCHFAHGQEGMHLCSA